MACNDEILAIACEVKPQQATLVPERREEITTRAARCNGQRDRTFRVVGRLQEAGIAVSSSRSGRRQIEAAIGLGSMPSNCTPAATRSPRRARPKEESWRTSSRPPGWSRGRHGPARRPRPELSQYAGRRRNRRHARIEHRHSIIARAMMVGMEQAVREMNTSSPDEWAKVPVPFSGRNTNQRERALMPTRSEDFAGLTVAMITPSAMARSIWTPCSETSSSRSTPGPLASVPWARPVNVPPFPTRNTSGSSPPWSRRPPDASRLWPAPDRTAPRKPCV